ncbi:MAG: DUF1559 domain-containing protein [Fuerstiella sp.]
MADTIYDFPPTIWQVQDWSFSLVQLLVLCLLVGAVGYLLYVHRDMTPTQSRVTGLVTGFVLAIVFANWLVVNRDASETYRPISLGDYVVATGVLVAALLAAAVLSVSLYRNGGLGEFTVGTAFTMMIVFVFIAILLPSVQSSRGAARRTQCKNNLKQLGLAMHNYHDVHNSFPLAESGGPQDSWRVTLLPYVEQRALFERYNQDHAWDSPENIALASEHVFAFSCPQIPKGRDRNSAGQFLTAYVAPTGKGTVFDGATTTQLKSITDGTSNTLLIMEARGTSIVWSEPRDVGIATNPVSVNEGTNQLDVSDSVLSSYHRGGAQALLADGSVRFVSQNIDPQVLQALVTKAGGEELPEDSW